MTLPVDSLTLLCPTQQETDLLRACLWSEARGRDAWMRWQRVVGDAEQAIRQNVSGIKSLLPLLHHGLRRSQTTIAASLNTVLSSATLAEKMRYETYARISHRGFAALRAAAIPFLVLRGAGLATTAYPERALRHSHDVDVLIAPGDRRRAVATLTAVGFVFTAVPDSTGTTILRDASGLPLALHERLFRIAYYTPPLSEIWKRAQHTGSMPLPAPADHLLHICGHASCSASRDGLKWVADAWYLIEGNPNFDWAAFLDAARTSRLSLPLATLLRYLAVEIEARVPVSVVDALAQVAASADRPTREVALSGVRAGRRGTLRNLMAATRSLQGRFDLFRWMVFPSPTSLRLGTPLRHPRAWPLYYAMRPLAYVARRAQRLMTP